MGGSGGSVVSITVVLETGQSGVRILVGERDFYILQPAQTGPRAYSVSCSGGTMVLSHGSSGLGVKTSHHHLVPRLMMSDTIPLLPYIPSWCEQEALCLLHLMCCLSFCCLLVQVGRRKEGRWDEVELFGTQGTSFCSTI